jgi:hypothetical protein
MLGKISPEVVDASRYNMVQGLPDFGEIFDPD